MESKMAVRYGPEVWTTARGMIEAGASVADVSRALGMTQQGIRARMTKEDWPKPRKRERAVAAASPRKPRRTNANQSQQSRINANQLHLDGTTEIPSQLATTFPPGLLAALSESTSPAEFQKVFSQYAKSLIAQGVAEIAPPTSIRDLATLHGLIYKADGLDKADKAGGVAPLVNPLRTVSRAATRVIEVDPTPGSAEFDAWEV